jgi:hypothetical protein
MLEQPRRRGRPPANPVDATPVEGEPTKRRRRASVGGLNLKLVAPLARAIIGAGSTTMATVLRRPKNWAMSTLRIRAFRHPAQVHASRA